MGTCVESAICDWCDVCCDMFLVASVVAVMLLLPFETVAIIKVVEERIIVILQHGCDGSRMCGDGIVVIKKKNMGHPM